MNHVPSPASVPTAHRRRAVLLGLAGSLLLTVALWLTTAATWRSWHFWREATLVQPAAVIHTLCWAGLAAACCWALLLMLMTVAHLHRASRSRRSPTGMVTHLAGLLLAVTTIAGTPGVSLAAPAPHPISRSAAVPTASTVAAPAPAFTDARPCDDPAPRPGWSAPPPAPLDQCAAESSGLVTGTPRQREETVTVRRGDSLWSIVARHLGRDADAQSIARQWPRWYEVNRAVIGDDPALLLPGQVLRVPSRVEATR